MRLRKLLPLLLVAANLLATTAFVPCSLFRTRSASLCATQEERELAMAEYFRNNNEETLQAILQLEEEKEEQIQALRMRLYENLNLALCQKEMEALRLKLERLREEKLELQAEQQATELQDLKIQLQALRDEKKRMEREKNTKNSKPIEEGPNLVSGPKRRLRQGVPLFKPNVASAQANNGAVQPTKRASPSKVKKESQKKDKVQKKGTIKLGPFTRND